VDDLALAGYLERSKDRILATLLDWLRIPSISADPAHAGDVANSAEFCARLLREAGLHEVEIIPADAGGADGAGLAPAVYGEWLGAGEGATTVLVYGHHDVQPVDPLDEWTSPPFEPVVVDGRLLARGSADDKGQVLMQTEAVRGLLGEMGALPVNLKFLIEGEEEVGSPHFEDLLERERERLATDVIVVSDTTMVASDIPSTTLSMRGLVCFDVALRTAKSDLHSGLWGGTVPNAAIVATRLVANLHDGLGRVNLPGFYDRVRELSEEETLSLGSVPFDEAEFCRQAGVPYLEGEAGRTPYERTGTRPTAEVTGLNAGYGGPGMKTIVPATANIKIAIRLVPDQDPEEIARSFRTWLAAQAPKGVEVTVTPVGAVAPLLTPLDNPAVQTLCGAIERVWGKKPLFTRSGGSGPEEALGRVLGAPVTFLGVALPDDNFHAPNEHLELDQLWRGVLAAGELLLDLGTLKVGQ
jgi:acetylornithine deacetylase/succinyl-diaminopimelate desuccinylase-like protein